MTLTKVLRGALAAAALLLAASAPTAKAATYHNVDCYCDPKANGTQVHVDGVTKIGCVCIQNYTLGKLETKEFRFLCKNENAVLQPWITITDLDKPTTCTITAEDPGFYDYVSKSCTNWSTLSTDAVKLQSACWLK